MGWKFPWIPENSQKVSWKFPESFLTMSTKFPEIFRILGKNSSRFQKNPAEFWFDRIQQKKYKENNKINEKSWIFRFHSWKCRPAEPKIFLVLVYGPHYPTEQQLWINPLIIVPAISSCLKKCLDFQNLWYRKSEHSVFTAGWVDQLWTNQKFPEHFVFLNFFTVDVTTLLDHHTCRLLSIHQLCLHTFSLKN